MLCRTCQYDLAGLTPNHRALVTCPECGLVQSPLPTPPPGPHVALRTLSLMVAPPASMLFVGLVFAAAVGNESGNSVATILGALAILAAFVAPLVVAETVEAQIAPDNRHRVRRVLLTLFGGWLANALALAAVLLLFLWLFNTHSRGR